MANPHKGEVDLDIDGETYKVSLSLNAMCELEDAFGRPLLAVISELQAAQADPTKMRISTIRTLVWGALQDHHPDVDIKEAGRLAGRAGLPAIMGAVQEAVFLAFPEAKSQSRVVAKGGGGGGNPRRAKG